MVRTAVKGARRRRSAPAPAPPPGETRFAIEPVKVAIFCGPSIAAEDVTAILPGAATFPPIERGILLDAIAAGFDVIGIIDGTYINRPTLGAAEIFSALEQGIHLYGAASLGALRAVEFERHGMQGIGTVFSWYRQGLTTREDEVVVLMHPQTFAAQCDALINLRYACLKALGAGIIERPLADATLDLYQSYFYMERRYKRLFEELRARKLPGSQKRELEAFETFTKQHAKALDLKRKDAETLLRHIGDTYLVVPA